MKLYTVPENIKVFGRQVKSFPTGIGEVFQLLISLLPKGEKRAYYGISLMNGDGKMLYYAAAEEMNPGEAEKYNCGRYVIEKGEYLVEPLEDWQTQTDCIKDVFQEMMADERVNKMKPAIEWYRDEKEMWCMLKSK